MKKLSSTIRIAQHSVYIDLRLFVDRIPNMALQAFSPMDKVNNFKFRIMAALKKEIV